MPKRINPLDRINIASPCSADWDEMVGNEQVRFCQHCSLYVHDLTKITRKDALKLVAASKGKLCVRYERRPDGTVQTATHAQPVARIKRRLSRIAAGAFTATLSLASSVAAQSVTPVEGDAAVMIKPSRVKEQKRPEELKGRTASLVGTILAPNEEPIPGAKITLVNNKTGREESAESDDAGSFRFQSLEAGIYTIKIESTGFSTYQRERLTLKDGVERRITPELTLPGTMGMIVATPDTPLIRAIWDEDMTEVRNLLAEGAEVNELDEVLDETALSTAVGAGNLELVRTLLNAGADPNARNSTGRTALMRLDDDSTAEIVRALVDAGAKVNVKDEEGDSALLAAAAIEKTEVLQALLDAGAKVNTKNKEGKTALMIAAEEGNLDNVRALLWAGADARRRDNDGATALRYARNNEESDEGKQIIGLLIAYGAPE